MKLFSSNATFFLSRKTKKQLVILILASLLHNFVLFPVHAADNDTTPFFSENKFEVIKAPESEINLQERLSANRAATASLLINADKKPELAKNFKVIETNTPLMDIYRKRQEAVHIASLNSENPGRKVTLTAYNSEVEQCDGDPCTTANGFNVCEHGVEDTVAANFLPLGTKIKIPELFGDRVFVVRDRTAKRFSDRVDVWMIKKTDALQFGVRHASIVVIE